MNNFNMSIKENKYSSGENYQLNRNFDTLRIEQKNMNSGDARDLFNKKSNEYENIDLSSFKVNDYEIGMPMYNPTISKNKKSQILKPVLCENNNIVKNYENSESNAYQKFEADNDEKNIEKGIIEYEYITFLEKHKELLIEIINPFALSFVWKSLLLLTKHPSNEKISELLKIKNKNVIIQSIKNDSELFNEISNLKILIPIGEKINTNFLERLKNIYNIDIVSSDKVNNEVLMKITTNYEIKIPHYYEPNIINSNLIGYDKNKIKFIKLSNVNAFINIDDDRVYIEISLSNEEPIFMGFIYDKKKINTQSIIYEEITEDKKPNYIINTLIFPKISLKKRSNYSKKFKDVLTKIHLGEVIYGKTYDIDIIQDINIDISVNDDIKYKNNNIENFIQEININHSFYFYVKEFGKVCCSGIIKTG